ncbi:MAG: YitT family protein [Lachnospiraceae bacterium]
MFEKLKYFSTIFFGTFIIAVGVYFFMNPNHIVSGSISGLAVVLVNFVPLSLSAMTLLLNIICIILAFLFVDKTFGTKIIFISVLLPALLFVFELLFPGPGISRPEISLWTWSP